MSKDISDVNIDEPRWDQTTFTGRLKYFAAITDVRKLFASEKQLDEAKLLILQHRLICFHFISLLFK